MQQETARRKNIIKYFLGIIQMKALVRITRQTKQMDPPYLPRHPCTLWQLCTQANMITK